MKAALAKKPLIRIAVVGTDPLQFVGFRAAFHQERDFELTSSSLLEESQVGRVAFRVAITSNTFWLTVTQQHQIQCSAAFRVK